ncbi:MAG: efflux RND transporter periplasmic adaptor subunit [Verrucomicrobiota bacterium]
MKTANDPVGKKKDPPPVPSQQEIDRAAAVATTPTATRRPFSPWKIILPLLILGLAVTGAKVIVNTKPVPTAKETPERVEAVEIIAVQPQTVTLSVASQGTVRPRIETQLTAEVVGRIEEVSENFRPGGFIRKGEMLIRIDPVNYESAVATAQANLAQARLVLAQEIALAEQAEADWSDLGRGDPNDLALRKPQLEQAQAVLISAEAELRRAERDLERTEVRAPYDGRVRQQGVDLGQFIGNNMQIGVIYSTDIAEVFLPLDDSEVSRLILPEAIDGPDVDGPAVRLSATFGGQQYHWEGHLVRTGAAFDSRSRLLDAVAEIHDPLAKDPEQPGRPVLKPGMFVEAEIVGREVSDSYVIPRIALRENNTVLVAQEDNTLERREVEVVQANTKQAIIRGGLETGDRVITSPMEYVIIGMKLKVTEKES